MGEKSIPAIERTSNLYETVELICLFVLAKLIAFRL